MPPLVVIDWEADGADGFLIEWHDPANAPQSDGTRIPLTGYFHLTAESIEELLTHQYRPNRRPDTDMQELHSWMRGENRPADASIIQRWRQEYDTILTDIIDRKLLGLKAVTSHGHADLEAVRGGAAVNPHNADPKTKANPIKGYIKQRTSDV